MTIKHVEEMRTGADSPLNRRHYGAGRQQGDETGRG